MGSGRASAGLSGRQKDARGALEPSTFCRGLAEHGKVAEWSKAHAWRACVGKPTEGSNPSLSE